MDIQVNTSNAVEGTAEFSGGMEDMTRDRLSRFAERLTRVELHFSDQTGARTTADDKRCAIEARIAGGDPITVTNDAGTLDLAASGALAKLMTALDRQVGKTSDRKGH